jgi:AbrB family looped-hinge helix DNA binding protein
MNIVTIIMNPQNRYPLFTATVNNNGQITIRSDVRNRLDLNPGDTVAVYELEKTG